MAFKYLVPCLALALSTYADNVPAFADHNAGWCYFCSDDGAPALCNSQCTTAINRLCAGDLSQNWIDTEGDCQIEYSAPVWGGGNGARPIAVTQDTCTQTFNGILNMCGKDAGDARTTFDPAYCTTSGGGGQYGWNDDGTVMAGTGRYKVITKNTQQCGQHEASWHQATAVIQWNDSWVGPNDQVVLDTNPPAAQASDFPEPPAPNPLCDTVTCDIFDHPYYAKEGKNPSGQESYWHEKDGYNRYQARWQGFSNDTAATEFLKSLTDRCHTAPYNFQAYMDGEEHVADFELPASNTNSLCWCISDGVYDASGGIHVDPKTWCGDQKTKSNEIEFGTVGGTPASDGELRRRGVESHDLKGEIGNFNIVSKEPTLKSRLRRWMS
ncbi:MAG: hypothetical protein Q9181_006907 [Wetmoreana brouardii]